MKYKEQKEVVADLRALADFYERRESLVLPKPYFSEHHNISVYGSTYNSETGNYDYNYDLEKSKEQIKRIASSVGTCEKRWDNDMLRVVKMIGKIRLCWSVTREAVCKKVPTGEKVLVPAYMTPARLEETYEWECTEVSLLS
jgi:hypothetical protein